MFTALICVWMDDVPYKNHNFLKHDIELLLKKVNRLFSTTKLDMFLKNIKNLRAAGIYHMITIKKTNGYHKLCRLCADRCIFLVYLVAKVISFL